METKRAYSKNQFIESEFDSSQYHFAKTEGTFVATLDCKMWGKQKNILAFITLENGNKIICSAWQNTNYLGIPEIEFGSEVTVRFEKAKNGQIYLREVTTDGPYSDCRL